MTVLLSVEDLLKTEKVSSKIVEDFELRDYMLEYVVFCIQSYETRGFERYSTRLEFIANIDEFKFNNLSFIEKMRVLKQVVSLLERKFVGFQITSNLAESESLEDIIISFYWDSNL